MGLLTLTDIEQQSNSVIMTFFLMMVVAPEVQKKAQAQIDAVVSKGRLPTIEDRPSLPYIDAIIREVLRYNPIMPLCACILRFPQSFCLIPQIPALPHATVDDDIYEGYHIPKGT